MDPAMNRWAWFKTPTDDVEGTLNLTYNAVDLPVIHGRAGDLAVTGRVELDYAALLDQVAQMAGALRWLGVLPGGEVGARLEDPFRELVALLATARLGATYVDLDGSEQPTSVVVTDRPLQLDHAPGAVIVAGVDPVDPARDVTWDDALRAGRTDPAGCEPVSPRATAYVADEAVAVGDVLDRHDRLATHFTTLLAGGPVTVPTGDRS